MPAHEETVMAEIRAFVAIELPDGVRTHLARVQGQLRPGHEGVVRWVDPRGIHLTLKFLGNIAEARVPAVVEAVRGAAAGVGHFRLGVGGLAAFPNLRAPRVVWVGLGGDLEGLSALQRATDRALAALGFPPEGRPFTPHLTLGRVRETASRAERQALGEAVGRLKAEASAPIEVGSVSLMRSQLTPAGAIYTRLASVALG
jgi:2'-5' RNA ligase